MKSGVSRLIRSALVHCVSCSTASCWLLQLSSSMAGRHASVMDLRDRCILWLRRKIRKRYLVAWGMSDSRKMRQELANRSPDDKPEVSGAYALGRVRSS